MLLQRRIERLGKARLLKPNHFGALDPEKLLQFLRCVMLYNGVMLEVRKNFRPAGFGDVVSDQHEVQIAFAARQRVASRHQNARA